MKRDTLEPMRLFLAAAMVLLGATRWVAPPPAAGLPPAGELLAAVAVDRPAITAGFPLLVRMTLRNQGAHAIELTEPIDELYGTAVVEIRRPGRDGFEIAATRFMGLKQLEGYRSTLPKGEAMAAYVLLLADARGRFVFDQAGRHELRARMRAGGREVFSQPVVVDVRSAGPQLQKTLASLEEDLGHVSWNEALDDERLRRLQSALARVPELRKALVLAEATTWIHRSDAAERARGAARLQELRDSGEALWKELATAMLALHFARTRELDAARRLLGELPYRSRISDEARQILATAGVSGERRGKPRSDP
jgi:hypothetical protein